MDTTEIAVYPGQMTYKRCHRDVSVLRRLLFCFRAGRVMRSLRTA